ncbi:MAG: HAD family hydrolase [Lachnospiraceae bacterium]|nr:HAD family hydrolase [Lachnospiraceae bacterium]
MHDTILFDLDGTLLPMDQNEFTNGYFKFLTAKMQPYGYDPKELIDTIWKGTAAMVKNDGSKTNEEVFWECFFTVYPDKSRDDIRLFNEFYDTKFNDAASFCGFNEMAGKSIKALKEKGYRIILASNPLFPHFAQKHRMRWAGVDPDDFSYITSYENSHYCKPNPQYYRELLEKLDLKASQCIMVGNDAHEDLAAEEAGISVFLLTDCLINAKQVDITGRPQGSFREMMEYIG